MILRMGVKDKEASQEILRRSESLHIESQQVDQATERAANGFVVVNNRNRRRADGHVIPGRKHGAEQGGATLLLEAL
jgi:hypothetical protein